MKNVLKALGITLLMLSLFPGKADAYVVQPGSTTAPPEIHYQEVFRLIPAFIKPDKIQIYENLTSARADEEEVIKKENLPNICQQDSDCQGTIDICSKDRPNDCRAEEVEGNCTGIDERDRVGTCDYRTSASYSSTILGTDFSESEGLNLSIEKLESFRNSAATTTKKKNPIEYGSHQLLLSNQQLVKLKLEYLGKAMNTKSTVTQTGEYPLGWISWNEQINCSGGSVTAESVYNQVPGNIRNLSPGWYTRYTNAIKGNPQWNNNLSCIPIYRTNEEAGYSYASICFSGLCSQDPRQRGNTIYSDPITGAYDAVKLDAQMRLSLKEYESLYSNIKSENRLLDCLDSTEPECTPSNILASYNGSEEFVGPKTLEEFGDIVDFRSRMNEQGLSLITGREIEEADAVKESPSISFGSLNLFATIFEAIFDIKRHHITIPGPTGHAVGMFQAAVTQSIDNRQELDSTELKNLSNAVKTEDGKALQAGVEELAAARIRSLQFFSCQSSEYSNEQTQIKDYKLGTRNACEPGLTSSLPGTGGTCDGELFRQYYGDSLQITPQAQSQVRAQASRISPAALNAYKVAEQQTGVPCEILAGVHWREGANNTSQSLQDGRRLSSSLEASAIQAATEIKGKVDGNIRSVQGIITALSRYNGGGNANCSAGGSFACSATPPSGRCGYFTACDTNPDACTCTSPTRPADPTSCRSVCSAQSSTGFPFEFSYPHCPTRHQGYDDPYAVNLLSQEHESMFILYQYDCTKTKPIPDARSGAFTFAVGLYNSMK